jgi:hypothetical protein
MSLSQRYLFVVVKRNVRNFVSLFTCVSVGSVCFDFIDESKALCFLCQVFSLADSLRPDVGILDGNMCTSDLVLRKLV